MTTLAIAAALVLLSALPAFAQIVPDAMLYELTEDMRLTSTHRQATSALGGFARPDNMLCPTEFAQTAGMCVVNAFGSNNIRLSTGRGPVNGDFTIVTQDTNPFDIEEEVQRRGNFRGEMDLSQVSVTFLGTMDATLTAQRGRGNAPFRGVVRIPIPCGAPPTGFCYVASGPDAVPTGVEPVLPEEFALGRPTVRLDVYFE